MKPLIVKTRIVNWFGASGITVFPFIFVHPDSANSAHLLAHETVHFEQQKKWAVRGVGVGLLAWFALYLLVLPVGWNVFRWNWEAEAMKKAELAPDWLIGDRLRGAPYHLWWM